MAALQHRSGAHGCATGPERLGATKKLRATFDLPVHPVAGDDLHPLMAWRTEGQQPRARVVRDEWRLHIRYRTSQTHVSTKLLKDFSSSDARWVQAGFQNVWATEEDALKLAPTFEEFVQRGFAGGAGGFDATMTASPATSTKMCLPRFTLTTFR